MSFSSCLEQIAESARSKRLSLWVGAGISRDPPASLPLANELKFCILEKICSESSLHKLYEDHLQDGKDVGGLIKEYPLEAFIERIYEIRHENTRKIVDKIAELFRCGSPNHNHFLIAGMMKKGYIRQILTTNFDLLIERALEALGCPHLVDFAVCSTEEQFRRMNSNLKVPTILKIHGSADDLSLIHI